MPLAPSRLARYSFLCLYQQRMSHFPAPLLRILICSTLAVLFPAPLLRNSTHGKSFSRLLESPVYPFRRGIYRYLYCSLFYCTGFSVIYVLCDLGSPFKNIECSLKVFHILVHLYNLMKELDHLIRSYVYRLLTLDSLMFQQFVSLRQPQISGHLLQLLP